MGDAQAAAAKELALVGKVEMRIALASSEKKLEDLLKIYLTPLLLKLGSEHVAVRNKVGISRLMHLHLSIRTSRAPLMAVSFSGHLDLSAYQYSYQVTVRIYSPSANLNRLTAAAETSSFQSPRY